MFFCKSIKHRFRRIPQHRMNERHRPRGIAVVMVLGLLAITLAISYATLRGQGTTTELARNNSRAIDARVAAQSGLAAAIRKISENAWGGVETTLSSYITNNSQYRVTFTTGDTKLAGTVATLTADDQRRIEYPFQLTIESTGYAWDPLNAAIRSEHKSRCVVQLVRKKMLAEPAGWSLLTASNVYQYSNQDAYVQFPVRMNGTVTLLGKLKFCTEYPGNSSACDAYLSGLNARALTLGDYRPFPQNLLIKAAGQDLTTMTTMLTLDLGTPALDPLLYASPPSHPLTVSTYKLYPGGKEYALTPLPGSLSGQTLAPDVLQNPLGIYGTSGALTIQNNVQVTGTIITDGSSGSEIKVTGTNVVLRSNNLPALYGTSQTYQLPAAIAFSNLVIDKAADAQINGAAMVWKQFEVKNDNATTATKFSLTGNLITDTLLLHGRSTWAIGGATWGSDRALFALQSVVGIHYFPDYEQSTRGFTVKPTLTFSPDSSGVKPHWHDWSQPVYQADPADPGLKWEVVRWDENQQ